MPGNLVVGEQAFQRFHTLPQRASRAVSAEDYTALAEAAMHGTLSGSSAGGRAAQVLHFHRQHHRRAPRAGEVFTSGGLTHRPAHARPACVRAPGFANVAGRRHICRQDAAVRGRRAHFLEFERFDRTATGRVGMVSLPVYDAEYVVAMDNWAATANRMAERQLLRAEDARTLRLLEAYGVLIANTDRHYGNISLRLQDDEWVLAPAYDMLPMLYAPVGGELVPRNFAERPPQPIAAILPEWAQAKALACTFWAAAGEASLSDGFRQIAAQNLSNYSAQCPAQADHPTNWG